MFAERIKQIRMTLNITGKGLAEQLNIPKRTIESYEAGREPSIKFLTQMCDKYNLNANWFITGKGEMFNEKEPVGLKDEIKQAVREMIASGELKEEFK